MPFTEHNGARLYYEKKGNWNAGRYPILLLHGNGESMEIFDDSIAPLLEKLPFLAIDTRGHGRSELLTDDFSFSYQTFADDVIWIIHELGLDQIDIIGFSDGAITALLLATMPDSAMHIMRVIAIGANTNPSGIKRFAYNQMYMDCKIAGLRGHKKEAALLKLMLTEPNITSQQLGKIFADVYIVTGSNDLIKKSHTDQLAAAIIHAKQIVIDGADHMIPQKFPARLRDIILDALV